MDVNEELKFLGNSKKKNGGSGGSCWGVRVDVNEELKFFFKRGGVGGRGEGSGWGGSGWM